MFCNFMFPTFYPPVCVKITDFFFLLQFAAVLNDKKSKIRQLKELGVNIYLS